MPNLFKILLCSCLEMVTVASSPRPSSAAEVETDTEYLKTARKGGGHKGWLEYEFRINLYTIGTCWRGLQLQWSPKIMKKLETG